MVWTLNIRPSQLREVYWSHTYYDLKILVKLKAQHAVAQAYQQYEAFRLVAAEALGGKKPTSNHPTDANVVGSFAELKAAFADIGGSIG